MGVELQVEPICQHSPRSRLHRELLTADRDLANARFMMIQSTADVLTSSAAVASAVGALRPGR